jgi:hypothetical protein
MLSHTLNVLNKGVFNMETGAVILAVYLTLWVALWGGDIKKDLGFNKPTEQTEKVNGDTTNTQK